MVSGAGGIPAAGRAGPDKPSRQGECGRQVHRLYRQHPARRARQAHLRQPLWGCPRRWPGAFPSPSRTAWGFPMPPSKARAGGATRPVASNDTPQGRALNRRVEVEFWHDDPLQELPDEPQLCPDASGAETVTRVYDSAVGRHRADPVRKRQTGSCPPGMHERLRQIMDEVRRQDQRAPALYRLHRRRAARPAHRRDLWRRHRLVHGAGPPGHGGRVARRWG